MLGGTYLTNYPEGEATLRITPGGARADIVEKVVIKAGELQKISIPIGAETHVVCQYTGSRRLRCYIYER